MIHAPAGGEDSVIFRLISISTCINLISLTGGPLHNLTDLHTTLQHTTELRTTLRLGCVLQGCVRRLYERPYTQPN